MAITGIGTRFGVEHFKSWRCKYGFQNSFFKYLSGAITKSTQEKKEAFEYLVLKALESYISKK